MNRKLLIAAVLLIVSTLLFGCAHPTAGTNTPTPAKTANTTPNPAAAAENIVDLVERGTVTFQITSGAINELGLKLQNTSARPLSIDIPAGTFFVNKDAKSQNMVVLHPASASIQPNAQAELQLEAACANLHLTEPTQENTFTIQRTPQPPQLAGMIRKLESAKVDYPIEQAAIWIVTDNATFDDLGLLVKDSRFGTSIIDKSDTVRAMKLVDEAGLSIRGYAIWGDLTQFLGSVSDADLSKWLNNQLATRVVVESTRAAQIANPSPLPGTPSAPEGTPTLPGAPAGNAGEISQYASQAKASSQYSGAGWSALQAVGAPDTFNCGDQSTAWASKPASGKDWLLLTFAQAVIPTRIVVYETYNPGAATLVEVLDENGNATKVYEAGPKSSSQCPDLLVVEVANVQTPITSVRVTLDHTVWSEIDAVQLIGKSK